MSRMESRNDDIGPNLCTVEDGLGLIENETFDFDLPVSPQECPKLAPLIDLEEDGEGEDEDEVFMGPIGFKEKCVATNAEITIAEQKPMSPPSAEQFAALFKEAWSVALELEQKTSKSSSSSSSATSRSDAHAPSTRSSGSESGIASVLDSIKEDLSRVELNRGAPKAERGREAQKSDTERFKRQVKRDMRSPIRRSTYTIAANQESPYPSAESPHVHRKVLEKKEIAPSKLHQPRPPQQAAPLNGRGSRLPTRGLRKPGPVCVGKGGGTHSASHAPEVGSKKPGTSNSNGNGLRKPAVKRLASPKSVGLRKPVFSRENAVTENKPDKVPTLKAPSKKLTLMKPSVISRPGQRNCVGGPAADHKPQPVKATMAFASSSQAPGGGGRVATKRTITPPEPPASSGKRKAGTPCTPVCQEKKVIPKRLLSSGAGASATKTKGIATPRRSSLSTIPRPSTPNQPSTPHTRHASITIPPSSVGPGSVRRRSSIPTPNRGGSTVTRSSSRLASAASRALSARPSQGESGRLSPLFLSPLQTPPQFKLSPEPAEEEVKAPEVIRGQASSPECTLLTTKSPVPSNVLRSRINVQEIMKETSPVKSVTPKDKPSTGVLIDFGSATPKNRKAATKPQQLGQTAIKENLIDF